MEVEVQKERMRRNKLRYVQRHPDRVKKSKRRCYLKTKDEADKRSASWAKRNPEKHRLSMLHAKYGLTAEMYYELVKRHGGICALCGREKKLVVDHCHKSGKVRGLLCKYCNSGLGWVESSRIDLEKLRSYAEVGNGI